MRILPILLFGSLLAAQSPKQILVIGIDGLSTEAMQKAELPNLKALMGRGAHTLTARGVMPTVSSPNWASIIMGAGPEQHGITSNEWQRDKFAIEPLCQGREGIFPTLFSVLRDAKPKAHLAAIYDWDGFGRLMEKTSANYAEHVLHSDATAKAAIEYWKTKNPTLLFVHLDDVDHAGHEHAWGSPKYFSEATRIDGLVGQMVAATDPKSTLVLVVSDHGGTNKGHGNANMNDLLIPILLAGPGVKAGPISGPVNIYDVAPTLVSALGVKPHSCWIGKSLLR